MSAAHEHVSVLLGEAVEALSIRPAGIYVDGTFGRGGHSRAVLARFGNMSSATILFVLADMMARGAKGEGVAIAFGPGLAAEAIRFTAPQAT